MGFLTVPVVQGYIAPTQSHVGWTGAAAPGQTNIIGYWNAGDTYRAIFDFESGAHISTQDLTSLSCSGTLLHGAEIMSPDGKFWGANSSNLGPGTYFQIDPSPTPWVLDASWGLFSNTPPTGTSPPTSQAWLQLGNSNWLVQGSFESNPVSVLLAQPPAYPTGKFGFWGHAFDTGSATVSVCAGPQNAPDRSSTAYWVTQPFSIFGTLFSLGKTRIGALAVLYDPATWPTANPYISSSVIKSYLPTDFDPAATGNFVSFCGPAYDRTDGNLIITVQITVGGVTQNYICKVAAADGSVLWKVAVPWPGGFDQQSINSSRIQNSLYLYQAQTSTWGGTLYVINTSNGTFTTQTYSGLSGINQQVSDDVAGCIIGNGGWDNTQGPIELLNGTPASGSTLVAVYFIERENTVAQLSAISYTRMFGLWQ